MLSVLLDTHELTQTAELNGFFRLFIVMMCYFLLFDYYLFFSNMLWYWLEGFSGAICHQY